MSIEPKETEKSDANDAGDAIDGQENGTLFSAGFASLLGVSFFGAANDNIIKQVLTLMVVGGGLWANYLGAGTQGIVSLVLTVPFIFLSGYAGQLADKFSKRDVILWVKIAEIPIALIAILGFVLGSFWLSLVALLLFAIQSSFYGPAKFGVIPDLVDNQRLSQANGLINAISNIAVILGSLAAGPLADLYHPTIRADQIVQVGTNNELGVPQKANLAREFNNAKNNKEVPKLIPDPNKTPQRLPAGLALLGVAVLGLAMAFMMPKIRAVNPNLKLSVEFLSPHIQTFKDSNRPLLVVLFSWSGFYIIAALALLLLPDYRSILGVSNTQISYLVGLLAISIGIGSVIVGFISGKTIRPYYSLFGALGLTVCFTIMGFTRPTYVGLASLIFLVGLFAGFYIVPLQALLQFLSPTDERGQFFGTANALSFVFISLAGVIYILLARFGMPPVRVPLVCAGLALIGTAVGMIELNRLMIAQNRIRISLVEEEGER